MKVLANDGISESGIKTLEESGFEVITTKVAQEQVANYINKNNVTVLLVRGATKVRKDIIDNCPSLKIIGRGGLGMDNIDVAYAREKGLSVINTPAAFSDAVAELVFAHLFTGVRSLHDANRLMPLEGETSFTALRKAYAAGSELRGKTLGIIGFGRVGRAVAKIALGLGMRVVASGEEGGTEDVRIDFYNGQFINIKFSTASNETIYKTADFISVHVPAQKDYLISAPEFKMMKDGVGIINAARGGVIEEVALVEALDSGKVAFAGLDVFEEEPKPAIQVLMNPKVSLTPHIGATTLEAQERINTELAEQVIGIMNQN
ncbi:MAG: 3-phosphoglycerate dehydrogenase [Flavobacterium sp. MedPE-SWcel]|uniref:D-2-hydroxyacid dehydrogenase n=1 Tax=uncultured Flavobacterium sp. TaxID=165435 RepID=UPI0009194EEC|nr:D-2-hydroxyacid dehydrogenase [uncultured Flavobacterium sp.]OIQ16906.1 MAG: 3-phosphoglycerate dehydrogenase [Flavobacterium sp. MedPE-SWcel]